MRAYDLIWKKRQGEELTKEEIEFLIDGFVKGEIPDYQISAWLMAVYFRGMTFAECTDLTLTMVNSGDILDLSAVPGIKVDKHSTGGVGDKTSLVLLPLVASCGVPVAKMSGRSLGHTGGTIDKLESIPGFQVNLQREEFLKQVSRIGIALAGQTGDLVPADKKLYALRDLTATVESIPLIASSIVSKKLAAGADAVVLDVKYGDGAFMRDYKSALQLAQTMVEIGNRAGRRFKAILSNMDQFLGFSIGNSLEVAEAIQTLKGKGPADLTQLCTLLGGYMVWLAGKAVSPEAGSRMIAEALNSGKGLTKFHEWVTAQGGDPQVIEDPTRLPTAPIIKQVVTAEEGWIEQVACRDLGILSIKLGAGRLCLEDKIKPEAGLKLQVKVGDFIKKGSVIGEIHACSLEGLDNVISEFQSCFRFTTNPVEPLPLFKDII